MTTQEVADRFDELSKEGKYEQIYDELYAGNAVIIEPENAMALPSAKGLEAIRSKGKMFSSMIEEMYGGYSKEPVVAGNYFCVAMGMDVKMKDMPRSQMDELAIYEIREGKIVKEQFFF